MPLAHPDVNTHGKSSEPTGCPSSCAGQDVLVRLFWSTPPIRSRIPEGDGYLSFRYLSSGDLEGVPSSEAQQLVARGREDRVRVTCGGPHLVIAGQSDVEDGLAGRA